MSLAELLAAKPGPRADYSGVATALDYGSPREEGSAALESAALFDLGWLAGFRAGGSERAEFLQGQLSNDVASLGPGHGCPCLLLNAQGRLIAILSVFNAGGQFLLVTEQATRGAAIAALEGFLVADDVELNIDEGSDRIGVGGPDAPAVLARAGLELADADLTAAVLDGQACTVLCRREFAVPVFELIVEGDAAPLWTRLEQAGARPAGTGAWDLMRLNSGIARAGVDVDEHRTALEGRLEWAVHRDKGCYVGQEVVERTLSRGRLNHQLCLLSVDDAVEVGALVEGASEHDVVSSVAAPAAGRPLAFAFVPRAMSQPGTELRLVSTAGHRQARVLEWPEPASAGRRQ